MTDRILILGGYGSFGARLSRALAAQPELDVLVAGRDLAAATRFCAGLAATPVQLDRMAPDLQARLAALAPFAVVDAAGPFQAYGADPYRLARAALAAGAHYLDLSDDAGFTIGIATLDPQASAAGLTALSGVSSVPAISSAAVQDLAEGIDDLHLIETAILPGNRAPRGLSVVRAILAQAGRPLRLWRGSAWTTAPGWSDATPIALDLPGQSLPPRAASLIGAPDLALFPARFNARSVIFRAGLELPLLHHGLTLLSLPVRARLIPSLTAIARPLRAFAAALYPLGTDTGGMRVRVAGLADGRPVTRDWLLLAQAAKGPEIPALPARIAIQMLREGALAPGARPCLCDLPLSRLAPALTGIGMALARQEIPSPGLFETCLGPAFAALPPQVQDLHQVFDTRRWQGTATVTGGTSRLARLVARLFGFPQAGPDRPLTVTIERRGRTERWTRDFAGRRFRSTMALHKGRMTERFGPFTFTLGLAVTEGRLTFPITKGRLGPIPIPKALLPRSVAQESTDAKGRFTFDVALSLPLAGDLVRYQGWLVEVTPPPDQAP